MVAGHDTPHGGRHSACPYIRHFGYSTQNHLGFYESIPIAIRHRNTAMVISGQSSVRGRLC